jgi:hypothetical protein
MNKTRISLKQFTIQHEKDLFTELEKTQNRLADYKEYQKKDGGYSLLIEIQEKQVIEKRKEWTTIYDLLNRFYGYDKW